MNRSNELLHPKGASFLRKYVFAISLSILCLGLSSASSEMVGIYTSLRNVRVKQAQEILGRRYMGSSVRSGEKVYNLQPFLEKWAYESLPAAHLPMTHDLVQAVLIESQRQNLDPVFLMAVIQSESKFDPMQVGSVGEIGLMQIRPETAEWVAKKFDIPWNGSAALYDPYVNIRIGAQYMAYLRDRFDAHAQLYISAYNMGAHSVDHNLVHKVWPKEYVTRVTANYLAYYEQLEERFARSPVRMIASAY